MSLRMNRRTLGFAVATFWLLMMVLLVRRELGPAFWAPAGNRAAEPLAGAREIQSRTTRMGLFGKDGQEVGRIEVRQTPEERGGEPGASTELSATAALNLLGRPTDLELGGSFWRPHGARRAEFDFTVASEGYDFRISGRLAEGLLSAEVFSAGETFPLELPVEDDLLFANGFGAAFELPPLEVGEEARVTSFDPLLMKSAPARLRCVARETLEVAGAAVPTRRIEVRSGGLDSLVWIDDTGEVVQAEVPFGLVLRKLADDAPAVPAEIAAGGELLRETAVRPRGTRPFRDARTLVLEVTAPAGRRLPEGTSQVALGGGRYRLTAPAAPPSGSTPGDGLGAFLAADAFVQSDHPEIRRQAQAIVGDETDPWRRALLLHEWVYEEIEKEPVVSIPSALEVLARRRGDCNEHAVLYTALARAAGLPARIAIGLVWSDELEGFYYHAWPEVWAGGWVATDPTLGQPLADATHLKLLDGGIETWVELLPYLGQLEIEVIEVR